MANKKKTEAMLQLSQRKKVRFIPLGVSTIADKTKAYLLRYMSYP